MKYGIMLAFTHLAMWPQLAIDADELGLDSIWLPDHLAVPDQMVGHLYEDGTPTPLRGDTPIVDSPAYLAFLAGQTKRIRLGTHVYLHGLRHPLTSARAFATVDDLSGGRLELGVGAGWLESEFDAVGAEFATRGRRLDEAIDVTRRLWTEQVVAHDGEFWTWDGVWFEPKPPQSPPGPPILIGGESGPALRRAAKRGNGWISMPHERLDTVLPLLARLRACCVERDPSMGPLSVSITCPVPPPRSQVAAWEDAGIERLMVRPWTRTSQSRDGLQRFAEEYL